MQLSELEDALMMVLQLPQDEYPQFQARMRHLANLGIPRSAKQRPGSGRRVGYSREDAQKILIAMTLGYMGVAPRRAVEIVGEIDLVAGGIHIYASVDCFGMLLINIPALIGKLDIAIEATRPRPKRKSQYVKRIPTDTTAYNPAAWNPDASQRDACTKAIAVATEMMLLKIEQWDDTHSRRRLHEA